MLLVLGFAWDHTYEQEGAGRGGRCGRRPNTTVKSQEEAVWGRIKRRMEKG